GSAGGEGARLRHPSGRAPDAAARVLRRAAHHRGGGAYLARGRSQPAAAPGADRPGGGHPHPPDLPGSPRVTGSRLLSGLVVAFVLVTSGAAALVVHDLRRVGPPRSQPAVVSIEDDALSAKVAGVLRRQGLLRHTWPFMVWARLSGRDRLVHWGEYLITTPLSPLELLARLTAPPDALHPLTVPEGLTVHDVVSLLAGAGFGSEESFFCLLEDRRFLASEDLPPEGAEGDLFPDTYTFPLATPQARILRGMIHRFHEVAGADFARRAADLGLTEHQAVTLASLVEAETGREDERRLVAAVFLNRMHIGMPLQ